MNAEIEKLRERIGKLKGQIAELQLDRLSRAETAERLNVWVDRQAASVNARALVLSASEGTGRVDAEALTCYGRPQADGHAKCDMAPYLCWLSPKQMKAKLGAELDALDDDQFSTMAPKDRTAALIKKTNELDDLERREEVAICEAEANGQHIARRRDCQPEIVLEVPETDNA